MISLARPLSRRLRVASLCAAVSFGIAAPRLASAQPASNAAQHFARGNQLYAERRFAEAAEEFRLAYESSRSPQLLFNLGRAYEDANNLDAALDALQRFERAGAPGYDRNTLAQRIESLSARIAVRDARRQTAPPPPLPPPPPPPPPPPTPPSRNLTVPIVIMSAGGALIAGAVPLWLSAHGLYNDLRMQCPNFSCPDHTFEESRSAGETRALLGDVLGGIGVAALVTGSVLLVSQLTSAPATSPRTAPARRATVFCTTTGCSAGFALTF